MIEPFGAFLDTEVFEGVFDQQPVIAGVPIIGLRYDQGRDIAWLHLCTEVEPRPALAWLSDDKRIPVIAHLDAANRLLSVGIGDASRLLPPSLLLPSPHIALSFTMSHHADALQVAFVEGSISTSTKVLTVQPTGPTGPAVSFVFEAAELLVAMVISNTTRIGHPTLLQRLPASPN
jgi:hypothetical protein